MGEVEEFLALVWKDFCTWQFIPIKLIFFLRGFSNLYLFPYLSIHMRDLDFTEHEKKIVLNVVPIIGILVPLLSGLIADRIGNFRVLQAAIAISGGFVVMALVGVPVHREAVFYPKDIIFEVSCPSRESPVISIFESFSKCHSFKDPIVFDFKVESCGVVCKSLEKIDKVVMNARSYGVGYEDSTNNKLEIHVFRTKNSSNPYQYLKDPHGNRLYTWNNYYYHESVRKLSKNCFYFPMIERYNFACETSKKFAKCALGTRDQTKILDKSNNFHFVINAQADKQTAEDLEEKRQRFFVNYLNSSNNRNLTCLTDVFEKRNSFVEIFYNESSFDKHTGYFKLLDCSPRCIGRGLRKKVCSNMFSLTIHRSTSTFWVYFIIMIFLALCFEGSFAMFKGAVMVLLRSHDGSYGVQMMFAPIGGLIGWLLTEFLMDVSDNGAYLNIRSFVFVGCVSNIFLGICLLFIDVIFKPCSDMFWTYFKNMLRTDQFHALLWTCFVLGAIWRFNEQYSKLFLEELGASKSFFNQLIVIKSLAPVPFLFVSSLLIKTAGHVNVIFIGLGMYSIRLFGTSMIGNPWDGLFFEALESIALYLSYIALAIYAGNLTTVVTDSVVQSLIGILHFGLGHYAGELIGSWLVELFGIRHAFQILSVFCMAYGTLYSMLFQWYLKKKNPPPPPELFTVGLIGSSLTMNTLNFFVTDSSAKPSMPDNYEDYFYTHGYDSEDDYFEPDDKIYVY